jgi:hypothetical protein
MIYMNDFKSVSENLGEKILIVTKRAVNSRWNELVFEIN